MPQLARLGGGWCSLELSGLGKRWSSFWRKSSNRKASGDSGGFEFFEFFDPYTGSSSFAIRLFSALSGFNHECQRRSIRFPYSELTAFVTCWSPHASSTGGRSSRNRICFNQIFYTAISTSWTLERGPCRKPSGGGSDRYSLSQKALRLISECSSTEHLSGYRSREARVELPILGWKRSETELNRPLTCNLGRFWAYRAVFPLNRADNEKTLYA